MSLRIPTFVEALTAMRSHGRDTENPGLWDGSITQWNMLQGGGGLLYDTSGRGKDGSLENGPIWRVGENGYDLGFTKSSSQSVIAQSVSWPANPGPITVSFWIWTAGGEESSAWSIGDTDESLHRIHSHTPWSDGDLYWDYGSAESGRVSVDFSSYLSRWTNVTLVATGSSGAFQGIYLDGKLVASAANSSEPTIVRDRLTIGGGWGGPLRYATAQISAFGLWDRILISSEIQQLQDPHTLVRQRAVWFPSAVAAPPTGNRRRRLLIGA